MKNKNKIHFLFFLLLAIFNINFVFACEEHDDEHEHEDRYDHHHCYCRYSFYINGGETDLGNFVIGQTYNNLPTASGNGNSIEFLLRGNYYSRFVVTTRVTRQVSLGGGHADIDHWSWEVNNSGTYGSPRNDTELNLSNLQLCRPYGEGGCSAWAKFRVTVRQLSSSSNASGGRAVFTVYVSVSVMC